MERLENNLGQAETALNIKMELKKELEGKGKKISEESRKWITDVSKLTDKYEAIQNNLAGLQKDEENLKTQLKNVQKRLDDFKS